MTLYPGQPDMMWDYGAWWTSREREDYNVFEDIVIRGMYQSNWGSFVEQWFIQKDYQGSRSSNMPWTEE